MGTIVCVIEGDEFYNRNAVLVWAQLGESAVEFRAHRSRPDGKWQLHRNGTELGRFVDIDDVLDYLEGLSAVRSSPGAPPACEVRPGLTTVGGGTHPAWPSI